MSKLPLKLDTCMWNSKPFLEVVEGSYQKMPMFQQYRKWADLYGKTYGYFEGPSPVLVTSDKDILSEVFVKQFKSFHARKIFPVQVDPDKDEEVHMFFAHGERWRRLRSIANPAFNTGKMRMMSPMINKQIDKFLDVLEKQCEAKTEFDIYDVLQRLTFDTIAKCVIFPTLHRLWISIYYLLGKLKFNPVIWLENELQSIINGRKKATAKDSHDLLELFLNSEYDPGRSDMEELSDQEDNPKNHRKTQISLVTGVGVYVSSVSAVWVYCRKPIETSSNGMDAVRERPSGLRGASACSVGGILGDLIPLGFNEET
ncbi:C13AA-like protein [Mya arenaria]|uniref:C13AA-like protein n=1 Tax=Mya arenaria TaxID=6604 RepID=A0ABY7FIG9_MYAAR|nr:C13AA-like protein [Mya arenaria]